MYKEEVIEIGKPGLVHQDQYQLSWPAENRIPILKYSRNKYRVNTYQNKYSDFLIIIF